LTAFYMFRLVFMTFFGKFRGGETDEHVPESPGTMTIPLSILAVLALIGGWIGIPKVIGGGNHFEHWLEPVFADAERLLHHSEDHSVSLEIGLMVMSVCVALIGIYLAFVFYRKNTAIPAKIVKSNKRLHEIIYNKYYVDEIYDRIIIMPLVKTSEFLWNFFDVKVVDGSVNGVAAIFKGLGAALRQIQTGFVQNYALMMSLGIVIILGYLLFR